MNTIFYKAGGWLRRAACVAALVCAVGIDAMAAPISREQAQAQARQFMQQRGDRQQLTPVMTTARLSTRHKAQRSTAEPYYVFDRGQQGEGFVIVAGDDAAPVSVLGYSEQGSFDYRQLPPALQEMLDGWAEQMGRISAAAAPMKAESHPKIEPMMKSKWSQGSPYNDECPMYFNLGRSVTGCVATAFAQLLYYQREKMVTEVQADIPAYDTWTQHATYGSLHVEGIPAGAPIDWDGMQDTYGSGSSARAKKAVAQLMHYCGVAVKMDYTNSSSGAQSHEVYNALRNYFGFGNGVRYVDYNTVTTDAQWDELLYNELAQGRPFYISGANSEGGHAFVCHGYDGAGRYYINWGWGGMSDGAYYLNNLTPGQQGIGGSNDGYNAYRECILGIEPENYADKEMKFTDVTARHLCTAAWDLDGDGHLSYGEAAAVSDLGTVLQGKNIKSFTELHYFTGLTAISDAAFEGCAQLTQLQLPRQVTTIGAKAFKGCQKLTTLQLPDGLKSIGAEAFSGCKALAQLELPEGLRQLNDRTFSGCTSLTAMTLPTGLKRLGDEAFSGCTALTTFTLNTMRPQAIAMGQQVFSGASTAAATLVVLQSTRPFFETDAQWSQFGTIREVRELSRGEFSPLGTAQQFYLYHVGTGRYLTMGEAWGTQAVVGTSNPMRFKFTRSTSMPEGVYYITSDDTGRTGHYLFRTNNDTNVGVGVEAAFVDGTTSDGKKAHWYINNVGDDTYTISIPQGYTSYNADCRWGVQTDHRSQVAQPTWGVYSDVAYEGNEDNCQWRLVAYDAEKVANYEAAQRLQALVSMGADRGLNVSAEQAVLNDLQSTTDALRQAQRTLRQRLRLIDFADDQVAQTCTGRYDIDGDSEVSLLEAAQAASLDENMFYGSTITSFDELRHFTSITALAGNCFMNSRQLSSVTLPGSIERIYYQVFRNCTSLTSITLPEYINTIGDNAFAGCTALKTVTVLNPEPQGISLGSGVFSSVKLAEATLVVPAGSKALYEQAPVWKDFGTIRETRTRTQPNFTFAPLGQKCYIMNVATRKFITNGEAYGTQGVVARQGELWESFGSVSDWNFNFRRADGGYLFRTTADSKVGTGVKACFVDGAQDTDNYWHLEQIEGTDYFTLQVPASDSKYVEGEYLGVDEYHQSGAASPTDGIYWDITYAGHERQCQWAFVTEDDMKAALAQDVVANQLRTLLQRADEKDIDKTEEQAVYDDLSATADALEQAVQSLRRKLHYIDFADPQACMLCIGAYDEDGDGELSTEEAAAVKELGQVFRGRTNMVSFDELRYFTGLTELPADAFRGATDLVSLYIPEGVSQLGLYAFVGCSKLRYVAMLNSQAVVPVGSSSMPKAVTLFVPQAMAEAYQADERWSTYAGVKVFTGQPVVSAHAERLYGRGTAAIVTDVDGAPVNGTPEAECAEIKVATTPVGEYVITVAPGTITTQGAEFRDGVFRVTPASLTITAQSYTRRQGEPNPQFEVKYSGWRNRETESVLSSKPVITCAATADSPAGEYPITVSGAEAQNYDITYVDGVLTVVGSDAIGTISTDATDAPVYDLQGRRLRSGKLSRGLYIKDGRKHTK